MINKFWKILWWTKNYQHVLNIRGFLVRTHEKWKAFIPTMLHRCLTCVLCVILTDKHNKKTIQVSSIKGTHIHLVDFITVYLTDFCVLVYISSNSGKAIDECSAMIQSMNSKITNDTWDEEDLGETTDSNIFFLLCYQENKNWGKKEYKTDENLHCFSKCLFYEDAVYYFRQ